MAFTSTNPATGAVIAHYPEHSPEQIEHLLTQAAAAHRDWAARPASERVAVMTRLGQLLEERADRYGALITAEMGKPLAEARGEVIKAAGAARHFADHVDQYFADEPIAGTPAVLHYESLGLIFGIMPWNLPFWQVLRFFIPTALSGNVVLLKHAETVQGSAIALEEVIRDAGAPAGVYANIAIERDAAAAIIADPRVAAVTLTGSERAGRAVAETAGRHGKKVVLELGGSDPFIVFADADFDKAVQLGITSRFSNNAQSCIAAKRFLIERPIFDRYVEAFAKAADAIAVGDPMQATTRLGPLAKPDILASIERQVDQAVKAGGRVVTGGAPIEGAGYFYRPTVLVGVDPQSAVAREEFFGPVALMFAFDSEDDAIERANDTSFGLGAAVWSSDPAKARRVAGRLQAGAVFVNDFVRSDARAPFGGTKSSGFGRELGGLGARELTNPKLIWTA
ncbi:aldehyde dehydrogenase family protein [uncultured Devosia sp.]|uniref:aldehyde dehydrogenase family protein n=1 Tax=uncultured Devosia sp. TaxID=211434 RepID=UPI0035CC051E